MTATWLLFGLLLRDIRKAGLVASLSVLLFFTFGRVREPANQIAASLSKLWVTVTVQDLDTVWIVIPEVVFLGVFAAMIAAWLKDPRKATGFLNVFAILLAAMPVFQILSVKAPGAVPRPPHRPCHSPSVRSRPVKAAPTSTTSSLTDTHAAT